jgi:type VI secretion system secreted protein VgrG
MASTRTQENRPIAIKTAFDEEALLFRRATVIEQLGQPFQIDVELLSEEPNVDFSQIVGTDATIRLLLRNGKTRYFNGFVTRFAHTGGSTRTAYYRMTLSPWLWFLTRASDCRIFQNMKAPDIIMKLFRDRGLSDFENSLKGTYVEREYTVQYRETDFNFVSRLMEEEGIYYYWDHQDGKHVMVLADEYASHAPYPDYKKIPYYPATQGDRAQEYIWDWIVEQQIQPGHYSVKDYNFKQPTQAMDGKGDLVREHAQPDFDMFDYPGGYMETADAEPRAKVRLGEFQAEHEIIRGRGDVRGLATGYTFTLENFPRDAQNKEHLVTSAVHELESDDYDSVAEGASDAPPYRVSFTAILASQQFRPRRLTPKPVLAGPQTAFVVGPDGEEIHTDKYGRVKVQFHWDRNPEKAKNEELTCWMRVAQIWAGKGWGAVFLPRVGHEVVVEFLEGDPDRPLITGSVYNGTNLPPYAMPDNKTQSTLKSNSSKGSGGFNEIRLEDKKGDEQIFIHGEKNQELRINNDVFEWIGHDRHLIVKNDQLELVEHDRNETVKNDHVEMIGRDHNLKVKGKQAIEIARSRSLVVKGDVIEEFKKNHSQVVSNDLYLKADNICIEALTNITLKVGSTSIAMEADGITVQTDGEIKVEAKQDISVETKMGLTMEATLEMGVKGTTGFKAESTAQAELSSPATTVSGTGTLTLSGGQIAVG